MLKSSLPAVRNLGASVLGRPASKYHSTGSKWYKQGGAYWPYSWEGSPGTGIFPYAFASLPDLLFYFEVGVINSFYGFDVYSLNGVSTNVAMCAISNSDPIFSMPVMLLYMAPSDAAQCWYYLLNTFGISPPMNVGSAVSSSEAHSLGVSYVSIGVGDPASSDGGQFFGSPSMSNVTLLNS